VAAEREGHTRARDGGDWEGERERVGRRLAQRSRFYFGRNGGPEEQVEWRSADGLGSRQRNAPRSMAWLDGDIDSSS
jgi:hypothetical protein